MTAHILVMTQLLARRILPSLCPLLWDNENEVREACFDVVQSLLTRIYVLSRVAYHQTGHQQWTKTGEEPKAPVDPPSGASSILHSTTGYVSSAVSWVAGSLMGPGKEKPREKEINAVSSQTVKSVLPDVSRTELSLEELERMGQKTEAKKQDGNTESSDGDEWGDAFHTDKSVESNGWKESGEGASGWDVEGLDFSDEEDPQLTKETQNLELIRQMAQNAKKEKENGKAGQTTQATQTAQRKLATAKQDDWTEEFSTTRRREKKEAGSNSKKISDDDLMAMLNDDQPIGAKKNTEKATDGWDDWDEKPATKSAVKPIKSTDGWDDWDDAPSVSTSKTIKSNDGWDDWDDKPASSTPKTSSRAVKSSDGWDDWDDKPVSKPASTPSKSLGKKSSGWDDDWDAKPASSTSGWDDDWGTKPRESSKKSDGWDDWDAKPDKNRGWDDDW